MRRGGETRNYRFDGNGNTRALTNSTGQITDTYRYTAFGEERAHIGTTENPYRFGGQVGYQYNQQTQDYYVRARPYEPERGRWMSKDPARFEDGPNIYGYCYDNPSNINDPSGFGCTGWQQAKPLQYFGMQWWKWWVRRRRGERRDRLKRSDFQVWRLRRIDVKIKFIGSKDDADLPLPALITWKDWGPLTPEFIRGNKTTLKGKACRRVLWLQQRCNRRCDRLGLFGVLGCYTEDKFRYYAIPLYGQLKIEGLGQILCDTRDQAKFVRKTLIPFWRKDAVSICRLKGTVDEMPEYFLKPGEDWKDEPTWGGPNLTD